MKKLIFIFILILGSSVCSAGFLTKHDYVLKKHYGDYILYILPNGMMYQYNDQKLTIEEVYLNDVTFEKFKFKSRKTADEFIESLGTIKCTTLKGIGKCHEPKETSEE